MKRIILLSLLTVLLSVASYAQGWQKVKRTLANGSVQRGWVRRDLTTYPTTSGGNASFYAAVNNGSLPLTLTNPASVPANIKARYSLNNNLLFLETSGDISQIKFERSDGTAMTGTNPGNVSLQSGVFYYPGPNNYPPFDKQWMAQFTPAIAGKSLKLTFKQSSGSTFEYSLIAPTGNVNNVALFGASITTTPPSSTTTTPPSTTNVSALTFQIVAYDCNTGVLQYRFASPNTTDLVTVSLPGMTDGNVAKTPNQTYSNTYASDAKVGRSQHISAGQSGQPSVSLDFVTSCNLGPTTTNPGSTTTAPTNTTYTPGGFTYTPLASTTVPAGDSLITFETANVSAIVALGQQRPGTTGGRLSGQVWKLYNKAEPDYSLIHYSHINPATGDYSSSGSSFRLGVGYGSGPFLYMNPRPHNVNSEFGYGRPVPGTGMGDLLLGTGRNPGLGDEIGLTPLVYNFGKKSDNSGYYLKSMMVYYNLLGVYARGIMLETWRDFVGKMIVSHYKLTTNLTQTSGDDKQQDVLRDDGHEWDCLYTNSSNESSSGQRKDKVWFYNGNNPCAGGGLSTLTIGVNGGRPDVVRPTEPFVILTGPGSSATAKGVGLILSSSRVDIKKLGSGESQRDRISPNTNTVYLNDNPKMLLDNQGTYYYTSTQFVGTVDEIRAQACQTAYRFASSPDDVFTQPDRLFWRYSVYGDVPTGGQGKRAWDDGLSSISSRGFWRVYFSKSTWASLDRTGVSWDAASNTKICVKMAYTGNRSTWEASWLQNGQLENRPLASDDAHGIPFASEDAVMFPKGQKPFDQKINFTVPTDGQVHVVEIPVGTSAKWANRIMEFQLKPNFSGDNSQETQADIYWIKGTSGNCPAN
ncbi:hypothetical protein [Spirosoma sp. KNUC1025]|uniref:hypothetical protein n=1 Tax=Spirosoma sp. KNUC1025 TaxID=2894082 RepID=UPI00386D64E1|nr:hypothetical protein LN737_19175 [Spirosoma sp. KNUC1025]